jgi:hypothetical protein
MNAAKIKTDDAAMPDAANLMPPELELVKDGLRLVSATFGVTLYTNEFFQDIPQAVLGCFEKFQEFCPPENLRFYATTNMRAHKPVTKRNLAMLTAKLKPGAPPTDLMDLELKDGKVYQDAPKFKFAVCAGGPGSLRHAAKQPNIVSIAFPPEWGWLRTAEMLALVKALCSFFPFQSGHAGFSLECSRYARTQSETHAWQQSMRHRGSDIVRLPVDAKAVGRDGLKGVGWLTMVGKPLLPRVDLKELRKAGSNGIEITEVPAGMILQSGPAPAIGDWNRGDRLPLYREVYRAVSPLVDLAADRSMSFNLVADYVAKTKAWYRRLHDE